jgi:uncharacterized protein (TIGR00369 family)
MKPELIEKANQRVLNVAMHRFMGLEIVSQEAGKAELRVPPSANILNNVSYVHGGVYYALLDLAGYLALVPMLEEGENAVTCDISCSILRAVPQGQELRFHGTVLKRGKRLAFSESRATADGKLVAFAKLTKTIIQGDVT